SGEPLNEMLNGVVELLEGAVACDCCFIYVLEEDSLVLRASKAASTNAPQRLKLKASPQKQPICIAQNAHQDPLFRFFNPFPQESFESFLSVPILSRGGVVGVINLQNRHCRDFDRVEVQLVSSLGLLVGAAVEIALLETRASELSEQLESRKLI